LCSLGIVSGPERLRAEQEQRNLQLEVIINGVPAHMISSFVQLPDGSLGATPGELSELGLHTGLRRSPSEIVPLAEIPSLKYTYEERTQTIRITIDDAYRQRLNFDLRRDANGRVVRPQAGWGTVLNYDLLGGASNLLNPQSLSFGGASLTLDGRAFSPYGTLAQSAILLSNQNSGTEAIRLDSSYRYSDPERLISAGVGDVIDGGLAWTRPIRLGGAQAQSNFALRPDLVTMPLPSLGGTAAVPSTVDVYVNNIKTFSQDVVSGPFSVSNIPLVTGAGNAQLVIRDASGQQTKTSLPFYASANLLASGLNSWSVEAGFPRLSYGSTDDTYVGTPVASATLRRGISDWVTVEGHAEGGDGVANGGIGAAVLTGTIGVAAAAISASTMSRNLGFQTYASYETRLLGFNINASSQRSFGNYEDLASTTARLQSTTATQIPTLFGLLSYIPPVSLTPANALLYSNARPPRALDRISVGAPFPFDPRASWNISFVHENNGPAGVSRLLAASYSRSLPYSVSIFATAFRDFGTTRNTGILVGLSIPFGQSASLSSNVSSGRGGTTSTVEAMQPLGPKPGDFGWQVQDSEGAAPSRQAALSYRSSYGVVQAGASQNGSSTGGALELRGAITTMGGDVFFSDRIDDAFAVVDAGVPGVEVLSENRPVGTTDSKGMLLVPTLRSYQQNKITVDPSNLPVDAELEKARDVVAPADRAGVLVSFKVRSDTASALVIFVRPDGSFVPAGSAGRIEGGDEFVVGYDGQSFIRNLHGSNAATIEIANAACRASFNFAQRPGEQVRISPVTCR
jgi:outer membrane usher protein